MLYARTRSRLAVILLAAVSFALPASSMSLADLMTEGAMFQSDGVTFSDFKVKIGGKGLDRNLASHEVTFENGTIQIQLAPGFEGKRGKMKLDYVASASGPAGLNAAGLDVDGTDVQVKNKLKGLGKLAFQSGKPDKQVLGLPLDAIESVRVKSKVTTLGASTVANSYGSATPVPEPGTAALMALGLGALAGSRRRSRR